MKVDYNLYIRVTDLTAMLKEAKHKIRGLEKTAVELAAKISEVTASNLKLTVKNAELVASNTALSAKLDLLQIRRTSKNSSKPPSSDFPPPEKTKSGENRNLTNGKRGGQPGHPGLCRAYLVADKVEHAIPTSCINCGTPLEGRDKHPSRVQQIEIPKMSAIVTDFYCHELRCSQCGTKTKAESSEAAIFGTFGPRLTSFIGLLSGKFHLSKRFIQEVLHDAFGVQLALGTVSNLEQQLSRSLAEPVQEARASIQQRQVIHVDETGWREDKHGAWMWVASCPEVAVFCISRSRGKKVAKNLIGETFSGIAVSDRWRSYLWLPTEHHQICWAHLKRDFQLWVDVGRGDAVYGKRMLAHVETIFKWWHQFILKKIDRDELNHHMKSTIVGTISDLHEAKNCANKRISGMAREILTLEKSLWHFLTRENVSPTNNFAERVIRTAVIWRKICFGTDSELGSRFAERLLTVAVTLRLQHRNVLEYLTTAYRAFLTGMSVPSLLPAKPA